MQEIIQATAEGPAHWRRPLAVVLAAAGLGALGLVIYVAWLGKPVALADRLFINPLRFLLLAASAFMAAWLLWNSGRGQATLQRAAAQLALLSFTIVLCMLAAEMAMRLYVKRIHDGNDLDRLRNMHALGKRIKVHSSHPLASIIEPVQNARLGYELAPNLDLDFGHHRVRTNAEGMRDDRNYSTNRPPRSVRILGLGDSGMFGWDCSQGQSYMDVLRRQLEQRTGGTTCEVLNLSVPGFNTDQEVQQMHLNGLKWRPDVVVVGWCKNDYYLPMFVTQRQKFPPHASRLWTYLFAREDFWQMTTGVKTSARRPGEFDHAMLTDVMVSGTEIAGVSRALQELRDLGRKEQYKILVFGPLDHSIAGVCKKLGLDYYNTFEKIPETPQTQEWGVHLIHPKPEGHRVLGEHLAQDLEERGWLTPRP